jgi:cell division FtsZ-interacting protein ZapD
MHIEQRLEIIEHNLRHIDRKLDAIARATGVDPAVIEALTAELKSKTDAVVAALGAVPTQPPA